MLLVLVLAAVSTVGLGVDLRGWLIRLAADMRQIPPSFVVVACALKTLEALFTSLSWRNILKAAFPENSISFRFVFGAYQGGAGIDALTPANAGTVFMLGLFRLSIPKASTPSILSAAAVQGLLFTLIAVLSGVVLLLTQPTVLDATETAARATATFLSQHDLLAVAAGVASVTLLLAIVVSIRRRVHDFRDQAVQGGAILRTPRRYLAHVALPQLLAYACRWGVTATFLAGMDIPVTARSVFLVIASTSLANALQVAPGGLGTTQALLAVALRDYTSPGTATAYSLVQATILTIWNAAFGFVALTLAFGIKGAHRMLRRRHHIVTEGSVNDASN